MTLENKEPRFSLEPVTEDLDQFMSDLRAGRMEKAIPTGFPPLDELLNGGLRQGLLSIGGNSGVGKTTFCVQLACQIAKSGRDVLFYSLEMSKAVIIAKILSLFVALRIEDEETLSREGVTVDEILGGKINNEEFGKKAELIRKAEADFREISDRIFITDTQSKTGTDDIADKLADFEKVCQSAPVVFVDYLQILKDPKNAKSDKQAVDENLDALNEISMGFNIPIILISSLNRSSYDLPVDKSSFKESGQIEYSSSYLGALQFAGMDDLLRKSEFLQPAKRQQFVKKLNDKNEADGRNRKKIRLQFKLLKQRIGPLGSFELDYFPAFNMFRCDAQGKSALVNDSKEESAENVLIEKARHAVLADEYH